MDGSSKGRRTSGRVRRSTVPGPLPSAVPAAQAGTQAEMWVSPVFTGPDPPAHHSSEEFDEEECGVPPEQEDPAMAVRSSAGSLATSSRARAVARPVPLSPPRRGRGGAQKPNPVRAKALPVAEERSGSRARPGAAVRSSRHTPTLDAGTGRSSRVSSRSPSPPWMGGRDHASAKSTMWAAGKTARAPGSHASAGADTSPRVPLVAAASALAKRRRLNTPAQESRSFASAAVSDNYRHRQGLDEVRADDRSPVFFSEPEDSDHLSVQGEGRIDRMERLLELLLQRQQQQGSNRHRASSPTSTISLEQQEEEVLVDPVPPPLEVPAEELLDVATKFAAPHTAGLPLNTKLAATVDFLNNQVLQEEVLIQAMSRHKAPSNCNSLNVPVVNTPIWGNISAAIRQQELKLQRILKLLTAGITAFARSVDGDELNLDQEDALALLCATQHEINGFRKNSIRPALNPKFAGLCKPPPPPPPRQLFGEDLSKRVKELDEQAKTVGIMRSKSAPTPSGSKAPYIRSRGSASASTRTHPLAPQRQQHQNQHQGSFLGQGRQRPLWKSKTPRPQANPAPPRPPTRVKDRR